MKNAWEKAADCESHARSSKDRKMQDKFRKLRDSWIRIANNAQFTDELARNAERLSKGTAAATGKPDPI
jgi:hypothetical protein